MVARPPPLPVKRGAWIQEKVGGRKELIVEGGVSE